MRAKRVFLIVLDSVGAGEMPDAASFGDLGANTLRSVWQTGSLDIPNLLSLGLGNIEGLDFLGKTGAPRAAVARMRERSLGKDTTVGHWEIAGHISNSALPKIFSAVIFLSFTVYLDFIIALAIKLGLEIISARFF